MAFQTSAAAKSYLIMSLHGAESVLGDVFDSGNLSAHEVNLKSIYSSQAQTVI